MVFLSTPSSRRATKTALEAVRAALISIHALLAEGDTWSGSPGLPARYFYPRPPRGGRHHRGLSQAGRGKISIHALLAEGDAPAYQIIQRHIEISIHALLAEGDSFDGLFDLGQSISIHALLAEGDEAEFQAAQYALISIHALREEGDGGMCPTCAGRCNFYPRPPRGGRRYQTRLRCYEAESLSTPTARRATSKAPAKHAEDEISIHALREEGDSKLADKIGIIIS